MENHPEATLHGIRAFLVLLAMALPCSIPMQASALTLLGEDGTDPFGPNDMPNLRLSGNWGYSYWIGGWDEDSLTAKSEEHFRAMKNSTHYDLTLEWFAFPRGSIGLSYINFHSRAETKAMKFYIGNPTAMDARDDISYTLVGPLLGTRQSLGKAGILYAGFCVGYLHFRDDAVHGTEPWDFEVKTYGLAPSLAWDIPVLPFVSVGITSRIIFANVSEYTINGKKMDLSRYDSDSLYYSFQLHRFDIGAGIRLGF
jgi:hypothetical protein